MNHVIPKETSRQREADVWRLRREGLLQKEIAEQLGISQPAVSKIIDRVEKRLEAEIKRDIEALRSEQAEAFDAVEVEALEAWEKSKANPTTKFPNGDPRFLSTAIAARTARGRLWGLDAPRVLSIEPQKTEPEIDIQAQQLLHSDPELQALSLQRARRELELRQRASGANENRSRGVWANLEQN